MMAFGLFSTALFPLHFLSILHVVVPMPLQIPVGIFARIITLGSLPLGGGGGGSTGIAGIR